MFNKDNYALLKASSESITSGVPILNHAEGNYNTVQYIAVIIGGVFAVGSLVYLIIEFVKLKTTLKQMKVKKTTKK